MAQFVHKHDRRTIYFTYHALNRWWDRCQQNGINGRMAAMDLLRVKLASAIWTHDIPSWARVTLFNRARAEGFLALDERSGFVINKNPNKEQVAVTYLEEIGFPND
jgi:hypothetical protein